MTPPNVQFIPASAVGTLLFLETTTTDDFGQGSRGVPTTAIGTDANLVTQIGARRDSGVGVRVFFANNTDRDTFIASWPSGSHDWEIIYDGQTAGVTSATYITASSYIQISESQWTPSTFFDDNCASGDRVVMSLEITA